MGTTLCVKSNGAGGTDVAYHAIAASDMLLAKETIIMISDMPTDLAVNEML